MREGDKYVPDKEEGRSAETLQEGTQDRARAASKACFRSAVFRGNFYLTQLDKCKLHSKRRTQYNDSDFPWYDRAAAGFKTPC